jgi:hypothetical protein
MRFKQVVTAKRGEPSRFLARASSLLGFVKDQLDCGCQVVIANPMRNASKVPKGLNMSPEKTLLVLRGETSSIRAAGVTEMHHEKLYLLSLATKDGHGFPPIHLSILARLEFQRQKQFRGMVSLFPDCEVLPDTRLTALIAFSLEDLKDPMRSVPLFAGKMVILCD